VGKWKRRFIEKRIEGISDEPRCGAPRKITDERVEKVIVKTYRRRRAEEFLKFLVLLWH
jgi:transposase